MEDFEIEVQKDEDGQDVLMVPMPDGTQSLCLDDALRLWAAITNTLEWLLPVPEKVIADAIKDDQETIKSMVAMLEPHVEYSISDGDPDITDRRHIFTDGQYELAVVEVQGRIIGFYCWKVKAIPMKGEDITKENIIALLSTLDFIQGKIEISTLPDSDGRKKLRIVIEIGE